MSFWTIKEVNNKLKVIPKKQIKCPICGTAMRPHHVGATHYVYNGWALDVAWKCPNCSYHCWFGIPIPESIIEVTKRHRGEIFEWWEDELDENILEKTKERLESFGYW